MVILLALTALSAVTVRLINLDNDMLALIVWFWVWYACLVIAGYFLGRRHGD